MERRQSQSVGFVATLAGLVLHIPIAAGASLVSNSSATCSELAEASSGALKIDSSALQKPSTPVIADSAATPAGRVSPASPAYCKVLAHIEPNDANAPEIRFELNLPVEWNGRALQYGGGGFQWSRHNRPRAAARYALQLRLSLGARLRHLWHRFGHESKPGEPPQIFALNDEAFLNFAHVAYKRVHDAAATLIERAYGRKADRTYFMGSSEGGREALTMAQRYPEDFDGIFARVPVINWTGLQHAGARSGLVTMGDGWIRPGQVKLVHYAVLSTCGAVEGIVDDAVGCKAKFDPATLACGPGESGDNCLSEPQVDAIRTLHAPYKFPFALANGVTEYPGWGVSGESNPSHGPTGGWSAWWLGSTPPAVPPASTNGIAWIFGAGGLQYIFARDPNLDPRAYKPEDHADRVRQVSALMDSDRSRSIRLQSAWRQADHARTHVGLRSESLRRNRLFPVGRDKDGRRRHARVHATLCRSRGRSCRRWRSRQHRYAQCLGRLGRARQGSGAIDGYRAEPPADDWDGPLAAAL